MSATRIHRLRTLAVQKLAAAYKADEIASSVMVMQGGSVFDDIADRVLKIGTWLGLIDEFSLTESLLVKIQMTSMLAMSTSFMRRFPLGTSISSQGLWHNC